MVLASYSFHFIMHLIVIEECFFVVSMFEVIFDYILFNTFGFPKTK